MADPEQHLANLEKRVRRLEQMVETHFGTTRAEPPKPSSGPAGPAESAAAAVPAGLRMAQARTRGQAGGSAERSPVAVTQILGWSGAAALVLAGVYFIRLAVDSGWLTPERQVVLAALCAAGLIGAGLALRRTDRGYASLLPAAGIVVLFATVFGAHIYYEFIGAPLASGCVVAICILTLWLGRVFDSGIAYTRSPDRVYCALVPRKSCRGFPPSGPTTPIAALNAFLLSGYAIWMRSRQCYLFAMYLALIGFDLLWRAEAESQWMVTAVFQAAQFLIFALTAALYSIRRKAPMTHNEAWAHAPGLYIFYAVEYFILGTYVPEWAPWIALSSAAVLVIVYRLARAVLDASAEASAMLVATYAALVLFHAVYVDLMPFEWAPWFALGMLVLLGAYSAMGGTFTRAMIPFAAVIGLMVVVSFLQLIVGHELADVPGATLLSLLFAAALYAGYATISDEDAIAWIRTSLLYAAHIAAMLTVSRIVDASLLVSIFWGMIAIGSLLAALVLRDRILGQSSLLIFALSGMKVLLFDLAGSPTPVRIGTLVVLGITLYVGGFLYKRLSAGEESDEGMPLSSVGTGQPESP